ncbi:MAG: glycoside hydrolase family 3 protein [Elusimicrobiaceae bacterium]
MAGPLITTSALFLTALLSIPALAAGDTGSSPSTPEKHRPQYSDLTESEKIAQTLLISMDYNEEERYRPIIQKGLVGNVLLQWGRYSLNETMDLIAKLQGWASESPHGVPLLIYADYEGGTVSAPATLGLLNLPTNMMIGAADNPQDTETLFHLAAMEMRRAGIHVNFAPVLDVNTNPENPIIGVRSFGSNPQTVSRLGLAVIDGLASAGVGAVAKHFPGHGDTSVDSHTGLPVISCGKEDFFKTHLTPFADAASHGVMGIMSAHIIFSEIDPENPATFSEKILTGLLREKLQFKGLIYSDSLDMKGALKTRTIPQGAVDTITAGADIAILGKGDIYAAQKAIEDAMRDDVFRKKLEDSSKKVFMAKQKLGLFDGEFNVDFEVDKAYEIYAGRISRNAVTAVRGGDKLPFKKPGTGKPKLCAIFFTPTRFEDMLQNFDIPFTDEGWEVNHYNSAPNPGAEDIASIKKCVNAADAVVFGTFQWSSKPYKTQIHTVNSLTPRDKPSAAISLMSPYDLPLLTGPEITLALYGINDFSILGAADILTGKFKPQGKLPVQLPEK